MFVEAMADPQHEQHPDLMRWFGRPFDPEMIEEDEIRKGIEKLGPSPNPRQSRGRKET
ncbi:hypothetical protein [Oricola cellulosilytica]|uniref:hypothetical protein n=1 Tax=Oricola cellulosilytica TaxID=1429082 RepID=UPI002452E755|nr:hypothetical protein [Oricola cellulosilytica]